VHTDQLISHGFVKQDRGHGRINAAAEGAEDTSGAGGTPDILDGGAEKGRRIPPAIAPADAVQEIVKNLLPLGCMDDLGMKLNTIDPPCGITDGTDGGIGGVGQGLESGWETRQVVAVTHPHRSTSTLIAADAGEQVRRIIDHELCIPVFPACGAIHLAAQVRGYQLKAVTYSEHGDTEPEDFSWRLGGILIIDAVRAPGQDDPPGRQLTYLVRGGGTGVEF
jgi:hypothetical protein